MVFTVHSMIIFFGLLILVFTENRIIKIIFWLQKFFNEKHEIDDLILVNVFRNNKLLNAFLKLYTKYQLLFLNRSQQPLFYCH